MAASAEAGAPLADAPSADAHDPNEVTVQMDAVRIGGSDGAWSVRPAESAAEVRREPDGPVFVDESGRRSRTFRRLGTLMGAACAVYAVIIVGTLLSGNSAAPWLPVPDQDQGVPAGQVEMSTPPSESAEPSPTVSVIPTPSATSGVRPAAPARVVPSPSASASAPSGSPAPDPSSAATTAPSPDATAEDPPAEPSSSSTPSPTPSASTGGPTPEPTTSPTGGGSAVENVALSVPAGFAGGAAHSSTESVL
ncbi:hypothetical protein [Streptomyces sp. C10-9-1]|uniref:hypothetical protein n=1 Tax=Streptomyces sp. C10-9-1 TaxID=1859285 RepID=UPI003F4A6DD4